MTHKTRGIVLRTVKYGDTSLIVHIYTELFGIQSYIVNGVRVSSKKGHAKAIYFQPGAILELIVYHNDLKNIQRIREFRWGIVYNELFTDVVKNSVVQYIIELLQKTIRQPEANPDLFHFIEDALLFLDTAQDSIVANYPLYFSIHLPSFFGFQVSDSYTEARNILELQEGEFSYERPIHRHYLEGELSYYTSQLLKAIHPSHLVNIRMNKDNRRQLLLAYQDYYALHIQDFGTMKTLPVLQAVLS